jgi:hypothetical protein
MGSPRAPRPVAHERGRVTGEHKRGSSGFDPPSHVLGRARSQQRRPCAARRPCRSARSAGTVPRPCATRSGPDGFIRSGVCFDSVMFATRALARACRCGTVRACGGQKRDAHARATPRADSQIGWGGTAGCRAQRPEGARAGTGGTRTMARGTACWAYVFGQGGARM